MPMALVLYPLFMCPLQRRAHCAVSIFSPTLHPLTCRCGMALLCDSGGRQHELAHACAEVVLHRRLLHGNFPIAYLPCCSSTRQGMWIVVS